MSLTYEEVAEILKVLDASQLDELVLELGDSKLVVRRGAGGASAGNPGAAGAPTNPAGRGAAAETQAPAAPPADAGPAAEDATAGRARPQEAARSDGQVEVRAPMVGTFYRAPSPGEPPFVEPGAKVAKGDPLCLIEVMKLYTTIEAPCDGKIADIAATDGELVEFDDVLFVLEPA